LRHPRPFIADNAPTIRAGNFGLLARIVVSYTVAIDGYRPLGDFTPLSRRSANPRFPLPSFCQRPGTNTRRIFAAERTTPRSFRLVEIMGFDPTTYGLQSRRSSQLSYIPSYR
jgi:hypothetical protein